MLFLRLLKIFCILLLLPLAVAAQTRPDSPGTTPPGNSNASGAGNNAGRPSTTPSADSTNKPGQGSPKAEGNPATETWIAFMPIILFALIFIIILAAIRRSGKTIVDFLEDKELQSQAMREQSRVATASVTAQHAAALQPGTLAVAGDNPAQPAPNAGTTAAAAATAVQPLTDPPKSTSRLLVFISGLTSVAIAACFCTFYMYDYLLNGGKPDISSLTNILYGLGLGVIPYGVTRVASALK